MKHLLRLEQLGLLALAVLLFSQLAYAWWWYLVLFLLPDLGMLGYLAGPRLGAATYNLTHHQGLAVLCYALGFYIGMPALLLAGTVLLGHSAFDRVMGYGLKYATDFKDTHLGRLGNS